MGGTGWKGLRVTTRLPYLVSGVAYPDKVVFDATSWSQGVAGVQMPGYFGQDWRVETAEMAWRE
ncbi:MAG: hypothetical protein N2039_00195 [Gemmataceae bacterium]|nr:hypothetical protein [Gemmataceae bacterium]